MSDFPPLRRGPEDNFLWSMIFLALAIAMTITLGHCQTIAQPNPRLTPGAAYPATREEICAPGYSSGARHVSRAVRKEVMRRYGVRCRVLCGVKWECDHWWSIENGGSNDIENLWMQPAPQFHWKDLVENYVHAQVCATPSRMTPEAARAAMTDWYSIYLRIRKSR